MACLVFLPLASGASLLPQNAPTTPDASSPSSPAVNRRDLLQTAALSGAAVNLAQRPGVLPPRSGSEDQLQGIDGAARAAAVFCDGPLLEAVQRARVFGDCKVFVDSPLKVEPEEVLHKFAQLPPDASAATLRAFVTAHFDRPGSDLVRWDPVDFQEHPPALASLQDASLREWGQSLNKFWSQLGRATTEEAAATRSGRTLLPMPHPFIVPGGRFVESYYWDNLWIIKGLLTCGMADTARGMIINMLHQLQTFGFIPNGGRLYYLNRSQPPTLSETLVVYLRQHFDLELLREALPLLRKEYAYWMTTGESGHAVDVELFDGTVATLNRYVSSTRTPRPESFLEDLTTASHADVGGSAEERNRVYSELAAAAESGWDFSSRWLEDGQSLHSARTSEILPVDLNSIMYRFETNLQQLSLMAGDQDAATRYGAAAARRQKAMDELFWNTPRRQWFDFHWPSHTPVDLEATAASNWLPLWAGAFDARRASLAVQSLRHSGIVLPGGVATTMAQTEHQWDWPNAWAPMQEMLIEGLERTGQPAAQDMALRIAQRWTASNMKAWRETHYMFEKYSAVEQGVGGGGGEYTPQVGFGWTNGVALSLLGRYGDKLVER